MLSWAGLPAPGLVCSQLCLQRALFSRLPPTPDSTTASRSCWAREGPSGSPVAFWILFLLFFFFFINRFSSFQWVKKGVTTDPCLYFTLRPQTSSWEKMASPFLIEWTGRSSLLFINFKETIRGPLARTTEQYFLIRNYGQKEEETRTHG